MKPRDKALRRVPDPDETAAAVWGEVFALRSGAKELFRKAMRAHKSLCDEAEDEILRKERQQKLDGVLWEAEALLNIATDMVAEHYKGDEPAEKEARS